MSFEPQDTSGAASIALAGMPIANITSRALVDHMFNTLANGRGGWLITANLDFVRRFCQEPSSRALFLEADLRVADGMPLVWASRLMGHPLPERIAGSALVWELVERASREGRRIFLLGGEPGAAEGARTAFTARFPELNITGVHVPDVSSEPTANEAESIVRELVAAGADLVFVALGSPKQERLIALLRPHVRQAWLVGVGVSLSFASGKKSRAPVWMQRAGMEWMHRLAQEPGRLARRYLIEDLPFVGVLFADALRARVRGTLIGK
jgi:N-acetylglucosaminyldiphosphoundecaprenol N-acetyl-beta-D-mannosaminyltransferase